MTDEPTPAELIEPSTVARDGARLFWIYIREQPLAYALAAGGAILFTSAIVVSSLVIGHVTDAVIVPMLAAGEPAGDALRTALLLILGVAVWKAAGIVLRRTAAGWLQFGAQRRVQGRLVARYLSLPLSWFSRRGTGDLISVVSADGRNATEFLAPLPFATGVVFLLFGTVVVVSLTDPWMGAAAVALLVLVVALDLRGSWRTFAAMARLRRLLGHVGEVAHESIDGALTIRALGREDLEVARLRQASETLGDQLVRVGRTWTAYRALTEALPALGTLGLTFLGTVRVADGVLTAGELVRVAYLLSLLAFPIRLLGYLTWDLANSVAARRRVDEVLDATGDLSYGELAQVGGAAASVASHDVGFGYEPGSPVLDGLSFDIPAGRTVAIVGPTGSGKTTITRLLARLWDPDTGAIRLDGRDLRDLERGVVPAEVAYVAQDTFLFDDTIAGNITLGLPVSDEDVVAAARLAGADTFIDRLPEAYDTRIGERGASLSGGQRQRLTLARALARRPRLLVLDDATSAVDPSVEAAILARLRRAELPSTVVVVAYRRSSIVLADEVLFVDGGRIVARGTHAELLRTAPGYARLLEAYEHDHAGGEVA